MDTNDTIIILTRADSNLGEVETTSVDEATHRYRIWADGQDTVVAHEVWTGSEWLDTGTDATETVEDASPSGVAADIRGWLH